MKVTLLIITNCYNILATKIPTVQQVPARHPTHQHPAYQQSQFRTKQKNWQNK